MHRIKAILVRIVAIQSATVFNMSVVGILFHASIYARMGSWGIVCDCSRKFLKKYLQIHPGDLAPMGMRCCAITTVIYLYSLPPSRKIFFFMHPSHQKKSPTELTIEDLKRSCRERIGLMGPFSRLLAGSESLGSLCYSS